MAAVTTAAADTSAGSPGSFIAMRSFLRERIRTAESGMASAVWRMASPAMPFLDIARRYVRRSHPVSVASRHLCFYDTESHRRALVELGLQNPLFCRIRGRPLANGDSSLADFASLGMAFEVLLRAWFLAVHLLLRRKHGSSLPRVAALMTEVAMYRYTVRLVERIPGRPERIYLADSYATRAIAIIDCFRQRGVPTNMTQHGLIQTPAKYKTHADHYYVWSPFEESKVRPWVRAHTAFSYRAAPVLKSKSPMRPEDRRALFVLNPVQGAGEPYPEPLLTLIRQVAKSHSVCVRLHPLDDASAFNRQVRESGAADVVRTSTNTWSQDLDEFSYFLVLNSTCAVDVMHSEKALATVCRKTLGYQALKVPRAHSILDVNSAADFKRFLTGESSHDTKGIVNELLGIRA